MTKKLSLALFFTILITPLLVAQQPPAAERGFDPDKVYAAGPIDSINTFNGNVIATIPLGETYRVSPALSYSFKAIHNGKTWDYVKRRITIPVPCDPGQNEGCTTVLTQLQAIPDGTANAGFGWRVQFARFIFPGDLEANTDRVMLETPDGAQHGLYMSLHDGDEDDGANYTRNGTYLRWRATGVEHNTAVDTPDGVTYEFTSYSQLRQMHDQVKDASGNYVNRVDIQYGPNDGESPWPCTYPAISQKITDTKGRTSYVCFANLFTDNVERPTVTDVYVDTPDGTGHYVLHHEPTEFGRENFDKILFPGTLSPTAIVPALTSITLPDGSSYGFQYFGTIEHGGLATGNFKSITLPTKGSYEYDYAWYQIPMSYDCPTAGEWEATRNPGILKREERLANGTVVGRTSYGTNGAAGGVDGGFYRCTTEQEGDGYFTAFAPGAELSNFVIPGDNRSKTVQYYSVWPGYNRLMVDSPDGFKRTEYGLPFTRNASKMRDGLFLSTETYLCTDALNAQCSASPVRATYVQYEVDAYINHLDISTLDHNPRLKKTQTVYFDDIDPITNQQVTSTSSVSNDDFDGLGHYRVSETSGFGTTTKRRVTTNYNPDAGTFPGTHTLPLSGSPWLLNLFTDQTTEEVSASGTVLSSASTKVCFNTSNGFLEQKRIVAGSSISPTRDLLAVFEPNGNGEVAAESYYGGDSVPLPAGFVTCSSPDFAPQYRITHNYSSGVLTSSQYDGTTFKAYDIEVYPSTSAISASRDTSGVLTTYSYDGLGRIKEVHPQDGAWTEYEYNLPTTSNGIPSVVVRQRPHGTSKSADATTEQHFYFDGMGRLVQKKTAMPNNVWSTVNRTYDFMGRIARESVPYASTSAAFDAPATQPPYTEFTYDELGRNTVTKAPDGKEINTEYFASQQWKTTSVATGVNQETPQTTRFIYDYLGRLKTVNEGNSSIITGYTYDIGDRLSSVQMSGSANT
ncbi:MAG: RHS repeat domain-containing protein, partial [Thermoanaerobaculia bacterium]